MNSRDLEEYAVIGLVVVFLPIMLIILSPIIAPLITIGWCVHKLGLRV